MAFGDEIQAAITAASSGTAPTKTFGSTPTSGNLLICWAMTGAASMTGPSGWSTGVYVDNSFGSEKDVCAVYYKVSDGTEGAVTCSTASDEWAIGIAEYEGPIDATPVDLSEVEARVANASAYTLAPAGTTAVADEMAVGVVYSRNSSLSYGPWTNSFSQPVDVASANKRLGAAFKVLTSTGTITTTSTFDTAIGTSKGGMVTFKKDAGGGGGRIMSSLAGHGGLAGIGGIAGQGGGLAG